MFDRLKTFIIQADSRLLPPPAPTRPAAGPRPFTASHRPTAEREQQLIGLTLENMQRATRRLSVADLNAAAIDLRRAAYKVGKGPSELLNTADPSGSQIFDHLAATSVDVKEKLGILLSLGCRIDKTNRFGDNAMHAAARLNNPALVEALALRSTTLSGATTARVKQYSSATPLAVAIVCGHADVARRLLRHHPGLNAPCCADADNHPLTPHELYARLDNHAVDMSLALRTGREHRGTDTAVETRLET